MFTGKDKVSEVFIWRWLLKSENCTLPRTSHYIKGRRTVYSDGSVYKPFSSFILSCFRYLHYPTTQPTSSWTTPALCCASLPSSLRLFVTPWAVAHQAPLPTGFSRQEHCRGCHALLQAIFPNQGSNLVSCVVGRFLTVWGTRQANGKHSIKNGLTISEWLV